jgi:hypothetical protein
MAAPPPPVTNLPLPPVPGLPPPPISVAGGFVGGMQQQPHNKRGGMPFTNTILITSAPSFLHSFRSIREWLYPCGSIRTAIFYPRPPKQQFHNNKTTDENDGEHNAAGDDNHTGTTSGAIKLKDEQAPTFKEKTEEKITVLVTLGHPDVAIKFLASFKEFTSRLDERYHDIQAYMVPNSPDVPLPPPIVDEETSRVLGEKLWQNFVGLEASSGDDDGGSSSRMRPSDGTRQEVGGNNPDGDNSKLDASRAAAAAGGAYDPEEDPLNAPQVLEAVKEFRRKLEKTQSSQKKRRMELVEKKLADMRPKVQAQMAEEKKRRQQQPPPPPQPNLLPPPLVGGLPPPPFTGGLPPPPVGVGGNAAAAVGADSGKRGRSNLPAWMTQQQQQQEEGGEPPNKRSKSSSYPENFPPTLAPSTHGPLREFLTNQVKESLGEEETTLIDFLYNHILQGRATSQLLQELQVVLEEESDGFLQLVWAKVDELAKVTA